MGKIKIEIEADGDVSGHRVDVTGRTVRVEVETDCAGGSGPGEAVKPLPELRPELMGENLNSRGQIQFRSLVKGADGKLYAAGYYSHDFLVIDPEKGTVDVEESTRNLSAHRQKWVDGVTAPNGKTYFFPNKAKGYLVFDPKGPSSKTLVGGPYQIRAGALDKEGVIYSPQYGAGSSKNGYVRRFDTRGDFTLPPLTYEINRTGPVFQEREKWEEENKTLSGIYDRYWGMVAAPNGLLVGIPFGSDRVLFVDPVKGEVWQGEDVISGLGDGYGKLDIYDSPYLYKYSGGVVSSVTGEIFSAGRHALGWLVVNPQNERADEIHYPPEMVDGLAKFSKSFSVFEGPDKRIWTVPWQVPRMAWIDPVTYETGSVDLSDFLETTGTRSNFYTYAQIVGNSVYLAPGAADYVARVDFT